MSLIVYTARLGCGDPEALDITRAGVDLHRKRTGLTAYAAAFAPSWPIVEPVIVARKRRAPLAELEALWSAYVPAYTDEMRRSYCANRGAWVALLQRQRVVAECYCTDSTRCHRTLLAGFLGKLGADVRGELTAPAALVATAPRQTMLVDIDGT